jgi:hypothetical protein
MENNTLLGATEVEASYDGSGVFNPTPGLPETAKEVKTQSTNNSGSDEEEEDNTSTNTLLLYGGAALLLYYFFFKKK